MVTGDGVRAGIARSLSVTASISNPCASASRVCCSIVSTTRARFASSRPLPDNTAADMVRGNCARIGCKRPTTDSKRPMRFLSAR